MNELFNKYSVLEVSSKTKISPIALEKLRDGSFGGISIIKLKGFLRILKEEYPQIEFNELEEIIKNLPQEIKSEFYILEEHKSSNVVIYIVLLVILLNCHFV